MKIKEILIILFVLPLLSCKIGVNSPEAITDCRKDTLLNNSDILIIGNSNIKIEITKQQNIRKNEEHVALFRYKDSIVVAYGTKERTGMEMFRKYNPSKSFEDFEVTVYTGKLKSPNFSSAPTIDHRDVIIETCKNGINFGGQYTLVEWMAGSQSQFCVVVDRKTGNIFEGCNSGSGMSYKKNSLLLIKDIEVVGEDKLIYPSIFSYVELLVWNQNKFESYESFFIDPTDDISNY